MLVLRLRDLIFKDVLGVLEDWGFDHIKCFTFITQLLEGHKKRFRPASRRAARPEGKRVLTL